MREAASVCYRQYHVNQEYKCRPIYTEYLRMIQHKNGIIHDHPDFLVRTTRPMHSGVGEQGEKKEQCRTSDGTATDAAGRCDCSLLVELLCACVAGG